jgi:hypothetical protein
MTTVPKATHDTQFCLELPILIRSLGTTNRFSVSGHNEAHTVAMLLVCANILLIQLETLIIRFGLPCDQVSLDHTHVQWHRLFI